jgi:tetratricopeptide (TPR) repeat protein
MFAGLIRSAQLRFADAIGYWEKCVASPDATFWHFRLLMGVYVSIGDSAKARVIADRTRDLAQAHLAKEPDNGMATSSLAEAYVALGEPERAREMVRRGMLLDPENTVMKVGLIRALTLLGDFTAALDIFEQTSQTITLQFASTLVRAPELQSLREQPRFATIFASVRARFAGTS